MKPAVKLSERSFIMAVSASEDAGLRRWTVTIGCLCECYNIVIVMLPCQLLFKHLEEKV